MTRARDAAEAAQQLAALGELARLNLPVYVADAGSLTEFVRDLRQLPGFHVEEHGSTLVRQVKRSLLRAAAVHDVVAYTEPDKRDFFLAGMGEFATRALDPDPRGGGLVAARDGDSFASFPPGQRWAEAAFNRLAADFAGSPPDILYGPLAFRAGVLERFLPPVPDDLGWGWRIYVIVRALLAGLPLAAHTGSFPCPPSQRGEDGESARLYRLLQLRQNVEGLRLAIRDSGGLT